MPIAKCGTEEEESTVRQSDRSSRDAVSDTNDETEQKDSWDDEAEIDDDLQLDIGGGR